MENLQFIGVDLHSNAFNICKISPDGIKYREKFSLNNPQDVLKFAECLDKNTYVMVEASTNTFSFCDIVRPYVCEIYVANPYKLKLISMVKKKTDKVDAEKLAVILKMQVTSGESLFDPVYIPDQNVRDLRSLFTTYKVLKKQSGSLKNRIRSLYRQNLKTLSATLSLSKPCIKRLKGIKLSESANLQVDILLAAYLSLSEQIKASKDAIQKLGANFIEEVDILTSMRGISVFTALAVIADIGDISRFPNSKKLCSYLRSAPGVDSSNETTRILSTNKQSRKLAVTFLTQALTHFKTSNPKLKAWSAKKDGTKGKGKLRMAICRKVFTEIYQMLKKKQYHYFVDEKNHQFKMKRYISFLKRQELLVEKLKAA
ncbi:MAG: IS110 family transposase [Leptospirales bacterium]